MKFNEKQLLKDRYALYQKLENGSKRVDKCEYWFFEPEVCRKILKSDNFSSKRGSSSQFAREAEANELAKFFDNWLMFRDDELHTKLRRASVCSFIRRTKQNWLPKIEIGVNPNENLLESFAKPFVLEMFSSFFQIEKTKFEEIIAGISPAISILGSQDTNPAEYLDAQKQLLQAKKSIIELTKTSDFLCYFLNQVCSICDRDTAIDVILNFIADGVHPTVAGLSSELMNLFCSSDEFHNVDEVTFFKDAPFQYVARKVEEDCRLENVALRRGERVIACIGHLSKEGHKDFAFGFGKHACPGRALAETTIREGKKYFISKLNIEKYSLGNIDWLPSVGYRALIDLRLELSQ